MIRRPPRSTLSSSSAASDVYKRQEDGTATETLNVSVIYPLNPPMPSDEQGSVKSFAPTPTPENKAREARVDRQLARMTKAEAKRNAPEGLSVDADGQGSISTTIEGSTESHWPTLRRLIRRARTCLLY